MTIQAEPKISFRISALDKLIVEGAMKGTKLSVSEFCRQAVVEKATLDEGITRVQSLMNNSLASIESKLTEALEVMQTSHEKIVISGADRHKKVLEMFSEIAKAQNKTIASLDREVNTFNQKMSEVMKLVGQIHEDFNEISEAINDE